MNYFVLFSVALIVVSVIVLVSPLNHCMNVMPIQEGFKPKKSTGNHPGAPTAAGQVNLSRTAGMADGSSSNQDLLDHLLKKHDRLAEAFENRDTDKGKSRVSATTTKKKGIASTGADYDGGDNVPIPVAGCNKGNCMKIKDPMKALDGNCTNATYPNGEPNYKIKYCPAYRSKQGARDEECLTCGYYKYEGICSLKDRKGKPDPDGFIPTPQNPSNCDYESYTYDSFNPGPMPGTDGGDDGGDDRGGDDSGNPICSTCKLQVNKTTQCVLPGCYSTDGYLPFPDDDGYNFAEGCFYYDPDPSDPGKILQGMSGRPPGYYCPPITKGESYDGGGGSGDPCYTKPDPSNINSSIIDYAKYVQMRNVCSNDKAQSKQMFKPEDVDDNPMNGNDTRRTKQRSVSKTGAINHQHQHGGSINVYHHKGDKQSDKQGGNKQSDKQGNKQSGNQRSNGQSSAYQEPVGGATVLGYL